MLASAQRLSASKECSRRVCGLGAGGARCSTPVGVKGMFTLSALSCFALMMTCAQRLSASKECSLAISPRSTMPVDACSTPVGVKGMFTDIGWYSYDPQDLCSTPVGVKGMFTRLSGNSTPRHASAQRLSASKECSLSHLYTEGFGPGCAQRLSASKECSRGTTGPTPAWIAGAQRLSASKECSLTVAAGDQMVYVCSTPVGVKGMFTMQNGFSADLKQMCSTPVGVKGMFTLGMA